MQNISDHLLLTNRLGELMDHTYKLLNHTSVARLIYPPRLQLSLDEMLKSPKFTMLLATPINATAVTISCRPIQGKLIYENRSYCFYCDARKASLRNKQLLVIIFKFEDQEFYVQAETLAVYGDRVELRSLAPRFYQRVTLDACCNVWLIPDHVTIGMTDGSIPIRRYYDDLDEESQTFYVIRDRIKNTDEPPESILDNQSIYSGKIQDISQGGCSIRIESKNPNEFSTTSVVYVETTLRWGKRLGNLSTFLSVRKVEQDEKSGILRAAFFDPLPTLTNELSEGARDYVLNFSAPAAAKINGKYYQVKSELSLKLPYGTQAIEAKWAGGLTSDFQLFLGTTTNQSIKISKPAKNLQKKTS